jgi:hypothetical protein
MSFVLQLSLSSCLPSWHNHLKSPQSEHPIPIIALLKSSKMFTPASQNRLLDPIELSNQQEWESHSSLIPLPTRKISFPPNLAQPSRSTSGSTPTLPKTLRRSSLTAAFHTMTGSRFQRRRTDTNLSDVFVPDRGQGQQHRDNATTCNRNITPPRRPEQIRSRIPTPVARGSTTPVGPRRHLSTLTRASLCVNNLNAFIDASTSTIPGQERQSIVISPATNMMLSKLNLSPMGQDISEDNSRFQGHEAHETRPQMTGTSHSYIENSTRHHKSGEYEARPEKTCRTQSFIETTTYPKGEHISEYEPRPHGQETRRQITNTSNSINEESPKADVYWTRSVMPQTSSSFNTKIIRPHVLVPSLSTESLSSIGEYPPHDNVSGYGSRSQVAKRYENLPDMPQTSQSYIESSMYPRHEHISVYTPVAPVPTLPEINRSGRSSNEQRTHPQAISSSMSNLSLSDVDGEDPQNEYGSAYYPQPQFSKGHETPPRMPESSKPYHGNSSRPQISVSSMSFSGRIARMSVPNFSKPLNKNNARRFMPHSGDSFAEAQGDSSMSHLSKQQGNTRPLMPRASKSYNDSDNRPPLSALSESSKSSNDRNATPTPKASGNRATFQSSLPKSTSTGNFNAPTRKTNENVAPKQSVTPHRQLLQPLGPPLPRSQTLGNLIVCGSSTACGRASSELDQRNFRERSSLRFAVRGADVPTPVSWELNMFAHSANVSSGQRGTQASTSVSFGNKTTTSSVSLPGLPEHPTATTTESSENLHIEENRFGEMSARNKDDAGVEEQWVKLEDGSDAMTVRYNRSPSPATP